MRPLSAVALLSIVASFTSVSCKSPEGEAVVKDAVSGRANQDSNDPIVFYKDDRNVDGSLIEITITPAGGKYNVSRRTAYVDRRKGGQVDETKSVLDGASCAMAEALITCRKDMRPADGPLSELSIDEQAPGKFKAILKSSILNRRNGELQTESTILGQNMSKKSSPEIPEREPVQITGDDGDSLYKAFEALGIEDTDRLIGATNLKVTGLTCRSNSNPDSAPSVSCSFSTVNARSGANENRTTSGNVSSKTIFQVLQRHGFSTNGGINPAAKAVSARSVICSLPTIPDPIASCVAEQN